MPREDYIDNGLSRGDHVTQNSSRDAQNHDSIDTARLFENGYSIPSDRQANDENDNLAADDAQNDSDWPPTFSKIDFILGAVGMILFMFDLASDWRMAISYYFDDQLWQFYLSAGFIIVPSLFSGILSFIWYIMEEREREYTVSRFVFCLRVVLSFLQLGRVYRSFQYLLFMVKGWRAHPSRQEHLRQKTIKQMQDCVILELSDGFLESALQLILQLYLSISVPIKIDLIRGVTLLLSLVSTAMTHTSYYRINRLSKQNKGNVGYIGSACYFLWRICELGPRFLLLAVSIHCFYPWCFIPIFLHFMFMFGFFCHQNPELSGICHNKCCNYPFLLLMSYIGTFCFVNLKEGKTKKVAIVYYVIFYTENILMATLIIWSSLSGNTYIAGWTYVSLSFIPGFVFQFLFIYLLYNFFHPNKNMNNTLHVDTP